MPAASGARVGRGGMLGGWVLGLGVQAMPDKPGRGLAALRLLAAAMPPL